MKAIFHAMHKLTEVSLVKAYHRNSLQILIKFDYNKHLISIIKSIPGTYWSKTLNCWYLKNTPKHLELLKFRLNPYAIIKVDRNTYGKLKNKKQNSPKRQLSKEHRDLLLGYMHYLKGKKYSKSTVKTYLTLTADMVEFYNHTDLKMLNNRSIEIFIERVMIPKNYSISTHRQFLSSLKHFKAYFPECGINGLQIVLPKKDRILPTVLSKLEILDLIRCTQNLKHRAIIALLYSCGLRIGELIQLRLIDIDIDRRQLIVKKGKGRKDRYIILAESILPLLSNYIISYQPKYYVFEGQKSGRYSAESIRSFLKRSCKNANIGKHVTPHTLRHSYATHLLESGIDIRYIQELLGHSKPETTMIYTHVSKKDLLNIKSPLDLALKDINTTKLLSRTLLSNNL